MAVWYLIGHWVPKCMDWNPCRSLHWSVFLTLRYKSSSSSKNSPAVACKGFLRPPEARGDLGHICIAQQWVLLCGLSRATALLLRCRQSWHPRAALTLPHETGAAVRLGVCPRISLQGSFALWASRNSFDRWVLSHADVFDNFIMAWRYRCSCYLGEMLCSHCKGKNWPSLGELFSTVFTPTALFCLLLKSLT